MPSTTATTLDANEIAKFTAIAAEWWDEAGKFAPLHRINPVRMGYIREQAVRHFQDLGFGIRDSELAPFQGLSAIDIGCGGGLVSEPLARMGFAVTGIDGGEKNIKTAQAHAIQSALAIDYRCVTAEELSASGAQHDLVLALEIIEHVGNAPLFLEACATLVKPGGLLVMSTLNRTVKAYGLAIVGAEYLLRWLPRGTHDWKKFLKPHEMVMPLQRHGMTLVEMQGLVYNAFARRWGMSPKDIDVNYMIVMRK